MRGRIFILCLVVLCSCKKENAAYDARFRGTLQLEFDNVVGTDDLRLTTGNYTNASGENFTVRTLRYFISNVILSKSDGSDYIVPQDSSYFFIDESVSNNNPSLKIPEGEYDGITFTIGVDSLRSCMDLSERKGVLLPTVTNYLDENRGYVFFSMEGTSPQSPENRYQFQIAGFGGKLSPTINNIKTVSLDLSGGGIAKIKEGNTTVIHILADISKVFTGTSNISLALNPIVGFEPFSANIANNYASMFRHDHTHNQ